MKITPIVRTINHFLGRVSSWLVLFMVAITFAIVVLRYVLDLGWIWLQESVIYAHSFMFLAAAGWTWARDGHVRIDILYRGWSTRGRAWVDLLGAVFLLFPFIGLIAYQSWPYVLDSWRVFEGSKDSGGIDAVFIQKSFILLFCLVLFLQGICSVITLLPILQRKPSDGA